MSFRKFKNAKNIWIASTSVLLIASVVVVSTVSQDNEVNIEKETGAVKGKVMSSDKSDETTAFVVNPPGEESDIKEEKVDESDGEKAKELGGKQEEVQKNKDDADGKVPVNKSAESTTLSHTATAQKSSEKAQSTPKAPVQEKEVSKTPAKVSPVQKEESKPVAPPAQEVINMTEKTYQTTVSLNMRSSSSANGSLIASIPKGTQLKSSQKQNNWFKVSYANKSGWVAGSYLKEVKPETATSPVAVSPPVTEKPAPVQKPKPTPAPAPAPKPVVEQNLMSRPQAEAHVSSHMAKDANGYSLMSGSGRYSVSVNFPTNGSGKAHLSVDGISYISGVEIKPEDFGQKHYDEAKTHLAQMNSSIKVYAETQFGIGSKEANTLTAEVQRMTLEASNGQVKKLTLQGVTITIAKHGISTNVYY